MRTRRDSRGPAPWFRARKGDRLSPFAHEGRACPRFDSCHFGVFLLPKTMPHQNQDLHGNVPDKSDVALLLIDVLNDLEFEGGEELLQPAVAMAGALARFKRRAKEAGIPCVYVN